MSPRILVSALILGLHASALVAQEADTSPEKEIVAGLLAAERVHRLSIVEEEKRVRYFPLAADLTHREREALALVERWENGLTAAATLPAGAEPFGRGIASTGVFAYTTVTLYNDTAQDAMVKLYWPRGRERLVRNFYVPAGQAVQAARFPVGAYRMEIDLGIDWDVAGRRFTAPLQSIGLRFNMTIFDRVRRLYVFHRIVTLRPTETGAAAELSHSASFLYP